MFVITILKILICFLKNELCWLDCFLIRIINSEKDNIPRNHPYFIVSY